MRRVVYSSSSSVYGTRRDLPVTELTPPDPISPYGVAKLAAERYCVSFSRVYTLETVVLRFFNVFGPRQSPFSQYAAVVPLFVTAIGQGEPITIEGDGEQSRDFTYVSNVVDASMRAAEADGRERADLQRLVGLAGDRQPAGGRDRRASPASRSSDEFAPPRTGDIRDSWADIGAARETLGYEPRIDLEEGLRLTVEYLLG